MLFVLCTWPLTGPKLCSIAVVWICSKWIWEAHHQKVLGPPGLARCQSCVEFNGESRGWGPFWPNLKQSKVIPTQLCSKPWAKMVDQKKETMGVLVH